MTAKEDVCTENSSCHSASHKTLPSSVKHYRFCHVLSCSVIVASTLCARACVLARCCFFAYPALGLAMVDSEICVAYPVNLGVHVVDLAVPCCRCHWSLVLLLLFQKMVPDRSIVFMELCPLGQRSRLVFGCCSSLRWFLLFLRTAFAVSAVGLVGGDS